MVKRKDRIMTGFLTATVTTAAQITESAIGSTTATAQPAATQGADFTILFIVISLLVSVILPIALIIWGKVKFKGSIFQIFSGIIGFLLFKIIVSNGVASIILPTYSDQNASSFDAGLFVVITVFCTEIGRFLLLFLSNKKRKEFGNAITFGGGYCLIESFIIVAGFLIPYLAVASGMESIEGFYQELRIYVQQANLVAGEEWRFLIKGFMAVVFCLLQVSVSVMMFVAVQQKRYWLVILPVLFDILILVPNRMSSFGEWYWGNLAVILPYLAIVTLVSCLVAYNFWKNEYKEKQQEIVN